MGIKKGGGLTAGEVWRVVRVGQEQVVGLGHPEVHHLGCVLQSPHRILVHHILQTHVVHLIVGDKEGNTRKGAKCKSEGYRHGDFITCDPAALTDSI